MSQFGLMIAVSLLAGLFAAGCTWVFIDASGVVGARISAWRERRRLEKEARAIEEAEKEADVRSTNR